ncbi:alanine--tRNA ligase [Elizabethkingia meningoseptica]|uniref:alanine--tRNA ligase n=1 Tax=Elizabethkingia meningoseptica TaxID=238 RepID=UPI000332D041|nr:alanine--tRNA ligase [Elizabethkingia meningoseptica]AQX06550.1 alanine--tRNA ligase [Elizabethkingia meningoseptica]AQX48596.1 alanine--tRNA ligase [Elizabethkingia meningoseptica]EOR29610.1 alanyl-tRNA ligase [Elizabethkingia meningoseptica ATCC 13253 = NBRC 12535]KUY13650.1 alanine--tRNA ligase [Elizabethkingia meningoseptica]OPB75547.1 alanine--tRNA ligase [Elizabethkingia meningoseptica]
MTSQEIRQKFLDFFKEKGHQIVPSAPIVLKDDPTLMFSNSGMTQFKDFFLGYKEPSSLRIADTQKCLRVSGKHNDLDDVGRDTYHHTMFEMLGNWSFGDYFKKEAISWAWELLTEVYKISKDDLYVTIFEGDASENLERDQDAYNFWKEHIDESRIINGNKKDNFWEMGDTGPCGPCSEIHVDIRSAEEKAKVSGKDLVNQDHPQVVEVWNLVFMEFLRKADKSLEKLPKQNVDTGMGFERLCMALQGKSSNYDTDVFTPLISKVEAVSGKKYTGILEDEKDIAIRVVVDHIRAVAFAIADGQLPSNGGAGYVIRRILRRAISYSYRFLDMKEAFLYQLVAVLKDQMGAFFPEIVKQEKLVTEVIREEENSFLKTIEHGLVRLDAIIQTTLKNNEKNLPGEQVFELYDTYGFPADLSRIIAEEKGLSIDEAGFEEEMNKQKQRSKQSSASKTYDWVILEEKPENFVGYDLTENEVKITRYRKIENKDGEFYQIVLDETPFYAEGGGQVGDKGILENAAESIEILDTKKENNLNISLIPSLPQHPNASFTAKVDLSKRKSTQNNHSATHLLHEALRAVLGNHVEQKGSFVGPDYLRFDFSHFSKMTEEELAAVEQQVNEKIRENISLQEYRNIPIQEALDKGAMALFGEKYGDNVRMIQFGTSRELCGGTHVKSTGEIGLFKIESEGSAAAGIRRIEAITGAKAREYFETLEKNYQEITQFLKSKDVLKSVQKLAEENQSLKSEIESFKAEKAKQEALQWKNEYQDKGDKKLLVKRTSMDAGSVKDIVFQLKKEIPGSLTIILSDAGEKPMITIGVSDDLTQAYQAGALIKDLAKEIQGGGGGAPAFATAGGKNLDGLDKAFEKAQQL